VRRGVVFLVLVSLALSSAPVARADVYVPAKATYRPSLGWVCWPRRAMGDFDGNGRPDVVVMWDRVRPHGLCDEYQSKNRWHVALLLGGGGRVQRPLPCEGYVFCSPAAGDLEGDGRDELIVDTCCGAIIAEYHVYRLGGSRLAPPRVLPPSAARVRAGPLVLSIVSDSGTHDGFGCRTHPGGVRVLVAYAGKRGRRGHWRFARARLRSQGGAFRVIGVRRFRRTLPLGAWPRGPRLDSCW